jgi:hypothetical protein
MRKLAFIALFCVLINVMSVFAVDCTDSDDGGSEPDPYIGEKASVTYGLTEKFDECVSGKDGYHLATSSWVREYYCLTESDLVSRKYKDYDCTRYGYTKCEDGKCIGKTTGANATKSSAPAVPKCGDHVIQSNLGEQCDPPDKICYDDSGSIGQCTRANAQGFGGCQCKVLGSTSKPAETAPVQNTTTTTTVTPPTTTPEPEPTPAAEPEPAAAPAPAETTSEERTPLPTEDLDDSNGISVTRGVTNAVKRFFRWIGSWFD